MNLKDSLKLNEDQIQEIRDFKVDEDMRNIFNFSLQKNYFKMFESELEIKIQDLNSAIEEDLVIPEKVEDINSEIEEPAIKEEDPHKADKSDSFEVKPKKVSILDKSVKEPSVSHDSEEESKSEMELDKEEEIEEIEEKVREKPEVYIERAKRKERISTRIKKESKEGDSKGHKYEKLVIKDADHMIDQIELITQNLKRNIPDHELKDILQNIYEKVNMIAEGNIQSRTYIKPNNVNHAKSMIMHYKITENEHFKTLQEGEDRVFIKFYKKYIKVKDNVKKKQKEIEEFNDSVKDFKYQAKDRFNLLLKELPNIQYKIDDYISKLTLDGTDLEEFYEEQMKGKGKTERIELEINS